jgi:PAS domain S-box-containing protein
MSNLIDVKERKQLEEKFQQQNEFLNSVLESLSHPLYVIDANDYSIVMANSATGLGKLHQNTTCFKFAHHHRTPCNEAAYSCPLKELKKTKKPVVTEHVHYNENGELKNMEIRAYPILDSEGNVVNVVESCIDITERLFVEEKIIRAAEEWEKTFNSTEDAIYIRDKDYILLRVNKAYADSFNMKPGELIGKKCYEIVHLTKEPCLDCPDKKVLGAREPAIREFFASNRGRYLQSITSPIFDEIGQITAFVCVTRDITERKQMEEELQKRNKQLDTQNEQLQSLAEELKAQRQELIEKAREVISANQLKSEFLANMSHELRTPLNSIIGFSELMIDEVAGKINEEQRQCLNDVLTSSQQLLNLINGVLDLSRIESGRMGFNLEIFNLTEVIASLIRTTMPILTPRKQSLDVEIEEKLPPIYADKNKLAQVLLNLVDNASKFSPDGSKIKIKAARKEDWCQISVIDNGIGVKKEDIKRLFEPFSRLDSPLGHNRGGTGLGLALVKQIVEGHGGRIQVESEYGKGSIFTFNFPLATGNKLNPK